MNIQLRTVNDVNFNSGRVTGNEVGKVTMVVHGANRVWKETHTVEVDYEYTAEIDGEVVSLKRAVELLTQDEINTLATSIAPIMPANLTDCEQFEFKVIMGCKIKFSETFSIFVTDIETI